MMKNPSGDSTVAPSAIFLSWRGWFYLTALTGLWTFGWLVHEPGLLQSIDYNRYFFFNAHWLRRELLAGELPWWNPHVGLGRPFLADLQTGVFYPPSWLHLLCGVPTATILMVWAHQVWCAFGFFLLGSRLGCTRVATWSAAVAFVVAPSLSVRFMGGQILYSAGLCYLPGLFWLAIRMIDLPSMRTVGIFAIASALQFLCGHPQCYWITHLGLGVFTIAWTIGDGWRAILAAVSRLIAAALFGLLLTSPGLLPFLELITESDRAEKSMDLSTQGVVMPGDWLALIVPPHGRFAPSVESQMLVGLPVLLMAVAALRYWRKSREVRALAVLVAVAALLASSLPGWLHRAVVAGLPGFAMFRLHGRLMVLVVFGMLLLAGVWVSRKRPPSWMAIAGGAVTILTFAAALPALKHWYLLPTTYPLERFMPAIVGELKAANPPAPPRIHVSARYVRENNGMLTGYSTFNGYVSLFLARVWEYVHAAADLPRPTTVITFPDVRIFERDPFLYSSMNVVAGFDRHTRQMRPNPAPDPRVYLCFAARTVSHWREAIRRMTQGHDFHATALVESPVSGLSVGGHGKAMITRFANQSVTVRTEARGPAILVLAEAWYPGWEAEVNGRPTRAFPVNGWMRGVEVPAGNCEVIWRYRSRWFGAGCVIGLAAFAVLVVMLRRKAPSRPAQV